MASSHVNSLRTSEAVVIVDGCEHLGRMLVLAGLDFSMSKSDRVVLSLGDALCVSVKQRNLKATRLLLASGADASLKRTPSTLGGKNSRTPLDFFAERRCAEYGVVTCADMYHHEPLVVCLRDAGSKATTSLGQAAANWIARRRLVVWRTASEARDTGIRRPIHEFTYRDLRQMVVDNDRQALHIADMLRISRTTLTHSAIKDGAAAALEWVTPDDSNLSALAALAIDFSQFDCLPVLVKQDWRLCRRPFIHNSQWWNTLLDYVVDRGYFDAEMVLLDL
jgi:hypothetical protein